MYDLDIPQPQLGPEFAFSINYADCISAAYVVVGPKGQLSCLFRLMHEGGTRVTSDMQPIALEYVLCGDACDIGPAQEHDDGEAEPVAKADQAFEKIVATTMPWLQFLDFKHPLTGESAAGHDEADETEDEVYEDHIWEGLASLERARAAEATASAMLPDRDFVAKVRGGESEVYKSGDIVHAMQGQCSGGEATAWARRHASITFKATFSEHGVAEAKTIVRAWCHRMQHFYNCEMCAPASSDFLLTLLQLRPT